MLKFKELNSTITIEGMNEVKGIIIFCSLTGQIKKATEQICCGLHLDLLEIETVRMIKSYKRLFGRFKKYRTYELKKCK